MLLSLYFCFESSRENNGVLRETQTNADWQRAETILIHKETGMILCSACVSRICPVGCIWQFLSVGARYCLYAFRGLKAFKALFTECLQIHTTTTVNDLAPGLRAIIKGTIPDSQSGKVSVPCLQPSLTSEQSEDLDTFHFFGQRSSLAMLAMPYVMEEVCRSSNSSCSSRRMLP